MAPTLLCARHMSVVTKNVEHNALEFYLVATTTMRQQNKGRQQPDHSQQPVVDTAGRTGLCYGVQLVESLETAIRHTLFFLIPALSLILHWSSISLSHFLFPSPLLPPPPYPSLLPCTCTSPSLPPSVPQTTPS